MTLRNLPKADTAARPGLGVEITEGVLARWNPDVRAADGGNADNTISVLEVIGEDWWTGGGVTAKRVSGALRAIGKQEVVVNINSPGGDVFEGLAIYELLRQHPAKVTVNILGLAASAASVIAMAGDEILVGRSAFLMIHNVWTVVAGDKQALREVADWLAPFDAATADIYAARTGMKAADLAKMMDREAWINASTAVDQGFADAILEPAAIDSGAKASAEGRELVAAHRLYEMLAKAGISVSQRRELIAAVKGGTPGAARHGTQDAAVIAEVQNLLNRTRAL